MKFKRLLAAILGALMITSCMSFVAGAEEAEKVVEEAILSEENTEGETGDGDTTTTYTITLNKLNGDCKINYGDDPTTEEKKNVIFFTDVNTVATATVNAGESYTIPEVTRVRANLLGWATEEKGDVVYEAGSTFTPEADTALYAVWERGTLTNDPLKTILAKGKSSSGYYYDVINNTVFYRYSVTAEEGKVIQVNSGGNHYHTPIGLPDENGNRGKLYIVGGIRTSYATGSAPYFNFNQSWSEKAKQVWPTNAVGTAIDETDTWVKSVLVPSSPVPEGFEGSAQLTYNLVGGTAVPKGGYVDYSAIAVFETEEGANAYDPIAASSLNVNFSLNYDGAEEITAIPEEIPTRDDGYVFAGWNTSATATTVISDLTAAPVPKDGDTYYAIWVPDVEEENCVYVSDNGDNGNHGRSSEYPVKTLAQAQKIINANSKIDTVKIVGTYSKKFDQIITKKSDGTYSNDPALAFGVSNRRITITGSGENAVFDMRTYTPDSQGGYSSSLCDSHFRLAGDILFDDITIRGSDKDGGFATRGYKLEFGDGVTVTGSQKVCAIHYTGQSTNGSVINIAGGKFSTIYFAPSSGAKYYGTATVNLSNATVAGIAGGHGWRNANEYYGIMNINVNSGTSGDIKLGSVGTASVSSYSGLRYFTINGGTVGNLYTTGAQVGAKYGDPATNYFTATVRDGVTVYEINGGTYGKFLKASNPFTDEEKGITALADDDSTRVIILNNSNTATVEDDKAIVIKTNGKISAKTTAYDENGEATYTYGTLSDAQKAAIVNWGKTIEVTGYSYTTNKPYIMITNSNLGTIYVRSNDPTGEPAAAIPAAEEAVLAAEGEVSGIIPADFFVEGENIVDFIDAGQAAVKFVIDEETTMTELQTIDGTVTFPEAEKIGHTLGWSKTEGGEIIADLTAEKVSYEGNTYYAVYTPNIYTVTYMLDGEQYGEVETYSYGESVTIKAAPVQEGYTFGGWKIGEADVSDFVMGNEDVVITGTLIIKNYTITFDAGEGKFSDGTQIKTVTAEHGTTPVFTEIPVLTGYTFADWEPAVDTATATATYTAKWTANKHTVIYYVDGEVHETVENVDFGTTVELIEAPAKEGHTFGGWKTAEGEDASSFTMPDSDVFFYGTFTVNSYTVTYKIDGEQYGDAETYEYGADVTVNVVPAERTGYTFGGWKIGEADAADFKMPAENVEITGTFTPNNYTVTYKVDGVQYGDVETYAYGATVTMREAPAKDGYTFSGWNRTLETMPAENVVISGTFVLVDKAATIALTVDLNDDRGTKGTSLATLTINGGDAVVIEKAGVGGDINYTITGLERGNTYTISVKKNGYVEGVCTVTVTNETNTLVMSLPAGDLKTSKDSSCGDGVIDLDDFVRIVRALDPNINEEFRKSMDINEDGTVNVADLAFIKTNFGKKIENATITFNGIEVTVNKEA